MKKKNKFVLWICLLCLFLMITVLSLGAASCSKSFQEAEQEVRKEPVLKRTVVPANETKDVVEEIVFEKNTTLEDGSKRYWHETRVEIREEYRDAYVVVQYTDALNTPKEAVVFSPDFTTCYSAAYLNENQDGQIIFEVKQPEKGVWTILMLDEKNLGTYRAYAIEKEEYKKIKTLPEEREVPY